MYRGFGAPGLGFGKFTSFGVEVSEDTSWIPVGSSLYVKRIYIYICMYIYIYTHIFLAFVGTATWEHQSRGSMLSA